MAETHHKTRYNLDTIKVTQTRDDEDVPNAAVRHTSDATHCPHMRRMSHQCVALVFGALSDAETA
jgi:hypothetical protein